MNCAGSPPRRACGWPKRFSTREIGPDDDVRLTSPIGSGTGRNAGLSSQTVARRYASALADVVIRTRGSGRGPGGVGRLGDDDCWKTRRCSRLSAIQQWRIEQKEKVLSELITRTKVRPTTANFLRILVKESKTR